MASAGALTALFDALQAERERRARARGQALVVTRQAFYQQLDEMHARRVAAHSYTPLSPARRAVLLQDLERFLAAHYGTRA
jgi:hypothetical protein